MKYQLNLDQTKKLTALPETGMGSQHVNIIMKNGNTIENVSVFNCQEFEISDEIELSEIEKFEIYQGPNKR